MSTHTFKTVNCVVSLETAASANRYLFSHLSVSKKLMKPSATAVQATKWLLINSLLSRGTITPQPDIRNEGCFIPEASGDQQMVTRMVSGRFGAFDVENIFLVNLKLFPGLLKSYMKTLKGWKRKTKNKETLCQTGGSTFVRKHTRNTRDKAGLFMSARTETGIIISV